MRVNIERVDSLTMASVMDRLPGREFSAFEQKTMAFCLLMSANIYVGSVEGKLACVWGLIPPTLMSNQAYLWMFTSELIDEHKFIFVRHSQRAIERMLREYPVISGHAEIGNARGIRWLKWLGAKFGNPGPRGVAFVIERKDG